jgi:hypothetical protein
MVKKIVMQNGPIVYVFNVRLTHINYQSLIMKQC